MHFRLRQIRRSIETDLVAFYSEFYEDDDTDVAEHAFNILSRLPMTMEIGKILQFYLELRDVCHIWSCRELVSLFEDYYERKSDNSFTIWFAEDPPFTKFSMTRSDNMYHVSYTSAYYDLSDEDLCVDAKEFEISINQMWSIFAGVAKNILSTKDYDALINIFRTKD